MADTRNRDIIRFSKIIKALPIILLYTATVSITLIKHFSKSRQIYE